MIWLRSQIDVRRWDINVVIHNHPNFPNAATNIRIFFFEHTMFCWCNLVLPQWQSIKLPVAWWCHQMETFSALLAICAGNSPVTGEFPAQRPVTRSFAVSFDLRLNKRLPWVNNGDRGWWSETPSRPLWRHCNGVPVNSPHKGQWRGALMFSLICAWINGWVSNREAGDLRRHRAHYDVIVMFVPPLHSSFSPRL